MNKPQHNLNIVPSGYRILFILYALLNSCFSPRELNKKLKENIYIEKSFTKEAILKFINTLKASGIEISKENGTYKINTIPWQIVLSSKNITTLYNLRHHVNCLMQDTLNDDYDTFIKSLKIHTQTTSTSKEQEFNINKFYTKHESLIKEIEKLSKKEQKIIVTCHNKKSYKFDNFKLDYQHKAVFLTGYNIKINENISINLDEIDTAVLSPQKKQGIIAPPTVIFSLKGKLALAYNLKANEKLLSKKQNEIIILNKGEDKQLLLRRLLKYKNLCKIISPNNFKEDFKTLAKKTLEAYKN